ncbi:MAG TPA: cyclic nucleotide-binding domain-containing protein [Methylophilaceae bacterium]|jgi:CRP-like cAMP-binding protein
MYSDIENLGMADKFVDDILEIINHIKLFEGFSVDEVRVLCHYMQCYAAPRGYSLLREGVEGDYLLLLLSGGVEVRKRVSDTEDKIIAEIGIGATLGEMSMIDGDIRFASCITTVPTDFAVFTRDALNDILVQMPRLGNKFLLVLLQLMTYRLRDTCDRLLPGAYGATV